MGDELVPEELTELLGVEPTTSYSKGDLIPAGQGQRTARSGYWSVAATDTSPADLDFQVHELLDRLPADLDVWADVGARFKIDLFCGWFMGGLNEGIEIAPDTLVDLGRRQIVLGLDIYGS